MLSPLPYERAKVVSRGGDLGGSAAFARIVVVLMPDSSPANLVPAKRRRP